MKNNPIILLAEPGYSEHFWYSDIFRGIQTQVSARNSTVEYIELSVEKPLTSQFDAIHYPLTSAIVLGYREKWLLTVASYLHTRKIPVVFPYMSVPYHNVTHAIVDYSRDELIRNLVFYFRNCGRENIALYGLKPDSIVDLIKIQQFLSACKEANCPATTADIYHISVSFDESAEALRKNVHQYNAVLCANDITAIHLINCFKQKGIHVPNDVFVSGMSNSILGTITKPSLTTSTLDFFEIGLLSIDAYFAIHRYRKNNLTLNYTQTGRIIIRESTNNVPSVNPQTLPNTAPMTGLDASHYEGYYNDVSASVLLKVESFLQKSDNTDREIIRGLLANTNRDQIAESLFISQSTYKYRLRRMKAIIGISSTYELVKLLKSVLL